MQARLIRIVELINGFGLAGLREPHVKHLTGKLWGIRVSGRSGIGRVIYATAAGQRVVLLRAFVKKTQRTPDREIEIALQIEKDQRLKDFETYKRSALKKPGLRAENEKLAPEFAVARTLIAAGMAAKLTQGEVAGRMGTSQSAVAPMESGRALPSTSSLVKYAVAVGRKLMIGLN